MVKVLFLILVSLQFIACSKTQSLDTDLVETVLIKIKANDQAYFSSGIQEHRRGQVDTAQINKTVARLSNIFQSVESLDSIPFEIKYSKSLTQYGILNLEFIIFNLQGIDTISGGNPLYFWITVEDENLFDIGLANYPPGIYFVEPKKTPHLDSLSFSIDSVSWFRLWYDAGESNSDVGGRYGYYGVEGKYNRLEKCDVYDTLKQILLLLNTSTFDSLDHNTMDSPTTGDDAEFVSIRLKFTNELYKSLNEFKIISCLSESKLIKEELFNFIVLIHSQSTRYIISKHSHPRLHEAITHLARKDYGKCIETRFD